MYDAARGRAWTAAQIAERLKVAFAEHFGTSGAISGGRKGKFVEAPSGVPLRSGQFLRRVQDIIGRGQDCDMLFAWARSQAGIGASLRETCRLKGWAVSSVYYRRHRACAKLAAAFAELAQAKMTPSDHISCGRSHQAA